MKKNTFKNIVEKEDGTRTYRNQNIWMHSVDRPASNNEAREIIKSFALLIVMALLMFIAYCILGGE